MRPLRWLWQRSGLAQLPVEYRLILAAAAIALLLLLDALTTPEPLVAT
jgi:hypothetical protein